MINPPSKARPKWQPKRRQREPKSPRRFLLYGLHVVEAALANEARKKHRLYITENAQNRLAAALAESQIPISLHKPRQLDAMLPPDAVHQGVILECEPLPERQISDIDPARGPVVVLDQVTDPHNVGAVIRSAAVFNAQALIVPTRQSPPQTAVLAKSASGALEHIALIRVTNLANALQQLADRGFALIGLVGDAQPLLAQIVASETRPLALIAGAEGKGLRHKTRENCHHLVRIPTPGALDSLNVSNAVAIALYETARTGA